MKMEQNLTVSTGSSQVSHSWVRYLKKKFSTGQAYLYVLPVILILGIFSYLPTAFVFYMSLFNWSFLNQGDQPFVGLFNYEYLFHHTDFWQSLQVTLLYVAISVPLHLVLALFIALCLMSGIRAKAFWRLAIFSPFIMPMVATTSIWFWMFDNYHGLFDGILRLLHLKPIDWLGDPHWTLLSIILYTTWKSTGFGVVIFMAGLANIPPALAEAARVDGASLWQVLRYIIWPLLIPITLVVLLLSTIDSFKMFQPVFLFVGASGGPANVARTLGLYLFTEGFSTNPHDGRGAALSVILFLAVFTIAVAQFGLTRRQVVNQAD